MYGQYHSVLMLWKYHGVSFLIQSSSFRRHRRRRKLEKNGTCQTEGPLDVHKIRNRIWTEVRTNHRQKTDYERFHIAKTVIMKTCRPVHAKNAPDQLIPPKHLAAATVLENFPPLPLTATRWVYSYTPQLIHIVQNARSKRATAKIQSRFLHHASAISVSLEMQRL